MRLIIDSGLFPDGREDVDVRNHLPVYRLIEAIRQEFSLPEGEYSLDLEEGHELNVDRTLEENGVHTGMALVFRRSDGIIIATSSASQAYLQAATGEKFVLMHDISLIGRSDTNNPVVSSQLAVDLKPLDPQKSSSRQHARIRKQSGDYLLESLRVDNPTFVNGKTIVPGTPHLLKPGDNLRFGTVYLDFHLE